MNIQKQDKLYIFTWIFTILSVSFLETILLDIKYQIFTGGFLQTHQISGAARIIFFVTLMLVLNIFFYGLITISFYIIARTYRLNSFIATYHLLWLMLGGTILVVAIRYQLYTYFGDFLTFAIVNNLGGGSLLDAIVYVIQEGVIAIATLIFTVVLWIIGARIVSRTAMTHSQIIKWKIPVLTWLGCVVGLGGSMLISNQDRDFHYHLNKTTAYLNTRLLFDQIIRSENNIYPIDIPDNGIDEDGLAGDLHFTPQKGAEYTYGTQKKHIVLIVLESVRGDVLEQEVNGQIVTPNLRKIASTGTRINNYFSHTGYTTSSLEAIFTSNPAPIGGEPVLLETLKKNGYDISVISGQDENFGAISLRTGTKIFSDYFFDAASVPEKRMFFAAAPGSLAIPNAEVVAQFKKRSNQINWATPQFFYLNFQSAHFPYFHQGMPKLLIKDPLLRNDIKPKNKAALRETYLNAVAVADQSVGQIVEELKRVNGYENTVFIVVGDHGESLFDDGLLGHGMRISQNQLNTIFVSNQLIQHDEALGHSNLGQLILKASGAQAKNFSTQNDGSVFHFIGFIDAPTYIGITHKNKKRLILNMDERLYLTEDDDGNITTLVEDQVKNDNNLNNQFDQLITIWETERWLSHLNLKNSELK